MRFDPDLILLNRLYISLLGCPPTGLGIRTRRILQALADSPIDLGEVKKILDLGCGRGVLCYTLARLLPHADIRGVDIDADRVASNNVIAGRLGLDNCSFAVGTISAEDAPPGGPFDMVISVDCIEHVEDDIEFLRGVGRVLPPGGRLFLHTPTLYRNPLGARRRLNFEIEGHVRVGYRPEELADKIKAAGLDLVRLYPTFGVLETLANEWEYAITRARGEKKLLFGLLFPFLNAMCYVGRDARPRAGSGLLVEALRT